MRILLTTTSYQDTPGEHHRLLEESGLDIVRERGPLGEERMLELIETHGGFDGLLNGDDALTARVIDAALAAPTPLKVISKYGIGLDSIDLEHAKAKKLPVLYTPGVNHTTVAEHTIGLMIAASKHFWFHMRAVKEGKWTRKTGTELWRKTLGVVGLGRIGKEVASRARAFGMDLIGFGNYWDEQFAASVDMERVDSIEQLFTRADVITLHTKLSDQTRGMINRRSIETMKDGVLIVNTSRGGLIVEQDVAEACRSGKLWGYAADVLTQEPIDPPHVFQDVDNVLLTPHVGSRTNESVQRQGVRATLNLINFLKGESDYIQANAWS